MKFKTIATFTLIHQAHLIKGKLESEGIPCIITDDNSTILSWLGSVNFKGIKVKVPEKKYQEALQILKEDFSEEFSEDDDYEIISLPEDTFPTNTGKPDDDVCCPFCHSYDVQLIKLSDRPSLLSKLTFGLFQPGPNKHYHCNICLNSWIQ